MVFSSSLFLFLFLPLLLFFYYIVDERFKNITLLIASLLFYAWGEPRNILLMLLSILINYALGLLIERRNRAKSILLTLSIIFNLGMLFIFKYLNFTCSILEHFLHTQIKIPQIALPIGISFFTFQIMSYVIDVYRGNVKAQQNLYNLALYVSLFPQLIAGPIVRYIDVERQINQRSSDIESVQKGFLRFCVGFSKKILIADQLSVLVDVIFSGSYPSILSKWVGMLAYTLQIYFDFSGYSDMAIGLGKVFGFDFLENFNYPYISQSIQEFWRRWHISLSSWFRDYLYIPLGGNRKGQLRTYLNLIIVFFMTGLWHGASFNFIVWGLFYVVFLIIERLGFGNILKKLPAIIRHIYSLSVIMIGWVFFRADTLTAALRYIYDLFIPAGNDIANFYFVMNPKYWFCLFIGILFSIPHTRIKQILEKYSIYTPVHNCLILTIFIIAISYMIGSGYSPFLYFRF